MKPFAFKSACGGSLAGRSFALHRGAGDGLPPHLHRDSTTHFRFRHSNYCP